MNFLIDHSFLIVQERQVLKQPQFKIQESDPECKYSSQEQTMHFFLFQCISQYFYLFACVSND